MNWGKHDGRIEYPPTPPVPASLVAAFEAVSRKRASELDADERRALSAEYLAASFGVRNRMTPHLVDPPTLD